jgi:hypothetical protein
MIRYARLKMANNLREPIGLVQSVGKLVKDWDRGVMKKITQARSFTLWFMMLYNNGTW